MSYLKHKPGSIEELMANEASKLNDNAYQDMFKKELDKAGKGIGSMTPAEKKAFFNKIDDKYKAKNEDIKEGRYEVTGTVTYQGVSGEDEVTVVVDAMDKMDAEDAADDMIDDLRSKKKIGPKRGGQVKAFYPFDVEYTRKKEGLVDKMMEKNEEVSESASQVQVKRDGKGNFNLMFKGKEIGYYHKSGSKYMVYYDNEDGDYNQSDEVSSEMQAKKLAYKAKDEAKVDELTSAQKKLPPALQKAIKDKEDKKESVDGEINQKKHDSYNDPKKGEKKPVVTQEEESFDVEKLKEDVNTLWSNAAKDLEEMKKNSKYMKAQDVAPNNDADGESEKTKGKTLVGSAKTKVETEPKVDYQK